MICPNCKNPVQENSNACEWCGTQLKSNYTNEAPSNISTSPKSVNWKDIPSGRKFILILFAIFLFLFIYFQINPIT
jgi:hypothetical protein